ncbi:SRPBCC domain-containing protein [Microbacterium sp. CIAB417]|uniref:SRPBCC domain-containing protein n=1 Tax=Microbacterium sp. CIAB417 TaxID=2860287 RepID=UPI001FACA673|nr:SRPBCC domain-containing protein [Microbacterium sp. CIAB417]
MKRTDEAERLIDASPARVFAAMTDPGSVARWLPPSGMTGRVERFEARTGGTYRIVLSYDDPSGAHGKTSADEDVVEGAFVEVVPGVRLVQDVEFESEDAAFAGVMRLTWEVIADGARSRVRFRAENVPEGISAEDHLAGFRSSLANLARLVEGSDAEASVGQP